MSDELNLIKMCGLGEEIYFKILMWIWWFEEKPAKYTFGDS